MSDSARTPVLARKALAEARFGDGCFVDPTALVGVRPSGSEADAMLAIGPDAVIRSNTVIYAGSTFGARLQTGHGALVRENNVIGDDVSVGSNAVLEPGNRIGDRVRIHSGCFLELVTVGDDVFIGPNVTFADDLHPPCPKYEQCVGGAVVADSVSIGANATILPGVTIGRRALVGAGSVVTSDVPEGAVVVGNPARVVRDVDELECTTDHFPRPYAWR